MNLADIFVIALLAVAVGLALGAVYKRKKSGGCCGGCSGCSAHSSCPSVAAPESQSAEK